MAKFDRTTGGQSCSISGRVAMWQSHWQPRRIPLSHKDLRCVDYFANPGKVGKELDGEAWVYLASTSFGSIPFFLTLLASVSRTQPRILAAWVMLPPVRCRAWRMAQVSSSSRSSEGGELPSEERPLETSSGKRKSAMSSVSRSPSATEHSSTLRSWRTLPGQE